MDKKQFINTWLENFAPNISKKDRRSRIKNQYIWHVFSFNLLPKETYLEGEKAIEAFNNVEKNDAIMFQLWACEETRLLLDEFDKQELSNIDKLRQYPELYIVGKNFAWSYIITHEDSLGFGPYFVKNQIRK